MAVTDTLRDAAYVTVGFGVLGFQKAQVRRHELAKGLESRQLQDLHLQDRLLGARSRLENQVAEGRHAVTSVAAQIDDVVAPIRSQLAVGLTTVEATLPPVVADLVEQARRALRVPEQALRARLGLDQGPPPA